MEFTLHLVEVAILTPLLTLPFHFYLLSGLWQLKLGNGEQSGIHFSAALASAFVALLVTIGGPLLCRFIVDPGGPTAWGDYLLWFCVSLIAANLVALVIAHVLARKWKSGGRGGRAQPTPRNRRP